MTGKTGPKRTERPGLPQLLGVTLALAGLFCAQHSYASDPQVRAGGQQTDESALKAKLESAGQEIVSILESGNPDEFLRHLSLGGLTVGIDAEPTDLSIIRKQFEERRLSYCLFFDTECYRKESAAARTKAGAPPYNGPELSLRDTLKRHAEKQRFISSFRQDGKVWLGGISVILDPKITPGRFAPSNEVDFGFKYETGGWKLADVEFNAI